MLPLGFLSCILSNKSNIFEIAKIVTALSTEIKALYFSKNNLPLLSMQEFPLTI